MEACGIILAGGKSSRMGRDKTLLRVGEETLIRRTVSELGKAVAELIIASNSRDKYQIPGTREVADIYPGMGPLGGIHAGLMATAKEYAFVVAADMPLFQAELARLLLRRAPGYDVVVPLLHGRLEPLCAVYARRCIPVIEECLQANQRQVFTFYPRVRVLEVGEDELASMGDADEFFLNLNTPEDYQAFCEKRPNRAQ